MISGLVPFEEIIEAVKDETGIANLRPYYEKLRRLLFRGEREIGYGGSVVLKKIIYRSPENFNGKYLTYPIDFIELEGVGVDCKPLWQENYRKTSDGIRFKDRQTKDVVLLYWGIFCDISGNPVTTRNHQEAIISYIVWKLYSPKIFLGIGNMNANKNYQDEFIQALLEARGDDAFPTIEEWNDLGLLSYSDRRGLLMWPTAGYNYCSEDIKEECNDTPDTTIMNVYYWQLEGVTHNLFSESSYFDDDVYLHTKPRLPFEIFEQGKIVDYTKIGRICFAIQTIDDLNFEINDALNRDVTDEFECKYFPLIKTILFVSNNPISYSSIYFKFKKIISNVIPVVV